MLAFLFYSCKYTYSSSTLCFITVIIFGECTLYGGSPGSFYFFGYLERLMTFLGSETKGLLPLTFYKKDLPQDKFQKNNMKNIKSFLKKT